MDTFKSQLLVFHKNFGGVSHEVVGKLQDFGRESGRKERNLNVAGQVLENALNLLLKAAREHLVGFVHHEDLEVVRLEELFLHHVDDAAWSADDNVDTALLEHSDVLLDDGATDAGVDLHTLVLSNRMDDVRNLHG